MHLIITISGEVAQMLTSTTIEWGLDREAQAASSFLRVRTRLECPKDNLRELMWHSNPNQEIARETKKKKKKKTFPAKTLMPCGDAWHANRTKDCAPVNTKGEQAGCHLGSSLPWSREAGVWQPEWEGKGLLQSQSQSPHLPPNCEQAASC